MCQINFIEQFSMFMEYARENCMHGRECMFWLTLFYLANKRAWYDEQNQTYEWPDDFFSVSNAELNCYGRYDKKAINEMRNTLKQRGLIDFEKGSRNKKNPAYKINYLTRRGYLITPVGGPAGVENTPNIPSNYTPNIPSNYTSNIPSNYTSNNAFLGAEIPPTYPPANPPTGHHFNKSKYKYNNISVNESTGVRVENARAHARGPESGGLVDMDEEMGGTDGLMEGWGI